MTRSTRQRRRTTGATTAPSGSEVLLLLGVGLLTASIVVLVTTRSNAVVQRWWWLVLLVGVVATLAETLLPARSAEQFHAPAGSGGGDAGVVPGPVPRRTDTWEGSAGITSGLGGGFDTVPATEFRSVVLPPSHVVSEDSAARPTQLADGSRRHAVVDPANAPATVRACDSSDHAVWRSDTLWVPKSSHSDSDHEDAWAVDDSMGRAALADGASSAFMARQWAQTITSCFLDDPPEVSHGAFVRWVDRATQQWTALADTSPGSTSWWAGESEKRGSFATLAGVRVEPGEPVTTDAPAHLSYSAVAVGDSCVVHLTHDGACWKRIMSFPIEDPAAFDKHPELIASTGARPDGSFPVLRAAAGQVRENDALLLMTDALAEFALGAEPTNDEQSVWDWLMSIGQDEFARIVVRAREAGRIEDDDTTVVRLRL